MRQRDPYFDAVADVCGYEQSDITRSSASLIAKAANEFKEICEPQEIYRRAEVYRQKYKGFDLTPPALAKHWPGLKPEAAQAGETEFEKAVRLQKERGLEPFKGNPYETQEQFIRRVNTNNVVNFK